MIINNLLDALRAGEGGRLALILPDAGQSVSYDELRDQVAAMAAGLRAAGVGRGDRVALALPNGLDGVVAFLAASAEGTAAPLNPGYKF